MNKPLIALMLAASAASMTAACKKETAAPGAQASATPAAPTQDTLAKALAGNPQLSTVAAAIKDTGLEGVLAGKASYTLFAPTNAAFAALGEPGKTLAQPEQRAALAALLRSHIVPGHLTAADLGGALDKAAGKPVKLRTMGEGTLSLTRDNGKIVVTAGDGSHAGLTADAVNAKNGAALGIDAVLKKLD